jgi:hypothetical protein
MRIRILSAALTLAALSALAAPALAQGQMCAARDAMVTELTGRYGESPQGSGLNSTTKMLEVWASAETGTWTILMTDTSGTSCIVAAGKDWYAFPEETEASGSPA